MHDPRITNISVDANALDRDGSPRDALTDRFLSLMSAKKLSVVVAAGVRREVQHPNTPAPVQEVVLPQLFNLRPGLNTSQRDGRQRVAALMQGNSRPGSHAADASHLSEADETGCAYFVTHDRRILAKRDELHRVLKFARIVTLAEFFDVFDRFEAERPRGAAVTPEASSP
jgi:hypothetical protein